MISKRFVKSCIVPFLVSLLATILVFSYSFYPTAPSESVEVEVVKPKPPVQAAVIKQVKPKYQAPSRGSIRIISGVATAYSYTGSKTRTGTWPEVGRTIAVDPKVISLGSEVYLICPTWPQINGPHIAEDTGGVIKGNKVDVYMNQNMKEFGIRPVYIAVYEIKED